MTYTPWTVFQAESGPRFRWLATNGRGRIFLVRDTREEAEAAIAAHRERIARFGRPSRPRFYKDNENDRV